MFNTYFSKKGYASLTSIMLGVVIFAIIAIPITKWYLSIKKDINNMDSNFEYVQILQTEYYTLSNISMEEIDKKMDSLKNGYDIDDNYKIKFGFGDKGSF